MNANRKKQVGLLLIIVVIAVLLAPLGQAAAGNVVVQRDFPFKHEPVRLRANPPVIPPHANAFGMTYGEWAAKWWQWAFALPADASHPLNTKVNAACSLGQKGKVWFLAGATENWPVGAVSVDRTCEEPIPLGKALFFPIVNLICMDLGGDGETAEDLLGCANFITDFNYPLSVMIDGAPVDNLEDYLVVSPSFTFETSDNPDLPVLYDFPPDTEGIGATSGYYLLLPPMPAGTHDIEFSGWVLAPDFGVDWKLHVHYYFTVGKHK